MSFIITERERGMVQAAIEFLIEDQEIFDRFQQHCSSKSEAAQAIMSLMVSMQFTPRPTTRLPPPATPSSTVVSLRPSTAVSSRLASFVLDQIHEVVEALEISTPSTDLNSVMTRLILIDTVVHQLDPASSSLKQIVITVADRLANIRRVLVYLHSHMDESSSILSQRFATDGAKREYAYIVERFANMVTSWHAQVTQGFESLSARWSLVREMESSDELINFVMNSTTSPTA